jgi:MFS transporter, SP family, solute carrier family 2 (facilitated glucose transporter), member 1
MFRQSHIHQLSVIALVGVIVFFAFGPGCIAWFLITEMFPMKARDTAQSLGIALNWVANWLVAFTFPMLLEYTKPYTFLVFVGTTGFFLYFTLNFVPETNGLTIAQVAAEFDRIEFPFL